MPAELARREGRLATIAAAMRRVEAQAKRAAQEERPRRAAAEAARPRRGQTRRGQGPKDVDETPDATAQSTCTDPELHLMRPNTQGWADCGKAQARVEGASQIMLACAVTEEPHAKQQAEPLAPATQETLAQAHSDRPNEDTGAPQPIPATLESGADSEAAALALEALGCDPSMATGRTRHHPPPAAATESPSPVQAQMAAQVRRPAGHELSSRRKVIVAPVCGQIKEGRGVRRFLRRGMQQVRGAWRLVCRTHNLRTLWRYGCVPVVASARKEVM